MRSTRRCGNFRSLSFCVFSAVAALFFSGSTSAFGQIVTLARSGSRYAGSGAAGFNGDFGAATTVSLNGPSYIVFDSNGNQFVSDTLNNCVRRIDTAGNMTTVAGLAVAGQGDTCNAASNSTPTAAQGLFRPTGLAIDAMNRLYIADSMHHCVRALASGYTGVAALTTVAGTCGSTPTASVTPAPSGLVIDGGGNLYISLQDSASAAPVNQVVRHSDGANALNVCLVAGSASANVSTPCGNANGVKLSSPSGLALDVAGDLFIADTGNHCVREIVGMSTEQTAVGQCVNDGSGTALTAIRNPFGIAFSPMQTMFITESNPDNVVSYTLGSTSVSLAGGLPSGSAGAYSSSQDGKSALNTPLNGPRGIAFDGFGNFLVADSGNNIARKLSSNTMFPNTPVNSNSATLPLTFLINHASMLSVSTSKDFSITSNTCTGFLAPASSGLPPSTCQVFVRFNPARPGIRNTPLRLTDAISGTTWTYGLQGVGTGALGLFNPGTVNTIASGLSLPSALSIDADGNAYVLESGQSATSPDVRLIPAGGGASSIVLSTGPGLTNPSTGAMDAAGNAFIADAVHGTIARFGVDGSVNTTFISNLDTPTAVYVDGFDNLFIAQAGASHNVIETFASGARRTIAGSGSNSAADGVLAASARFVSPSALTADLNGILYVADAGAHLVYAIDKAGIIHQVAGNGSTSTDFPGQANGTGLISPVSLAADAAGDLYIADKGANRVYTVYASSSNGNNIATVLGTGVAGSLGDGGFSNVAQVNEPLAVALDGSSNLFVIDGGSNSVRQITYGTPTLDFGTVAVGQNSAALVQAVANVGTVSLNLTSAVNTSDTHFAMDLGSSNCGSAMLPGGLCNLGFVFTPTDAAAYTATASLMSNSYNSPQAITLKAQGKQLASLAFTLPAQTEVYGQPFNEVVNTNTSGPAPTGTITFAANGKVLCSATGTATGMSTTCAAPNSGFPVGIYPVTFTYSGDGNYMAASGTTTLAVTQQPLNVAVNNASRLYGTANPAFTGLVTGIANGDTVLVSYATTASINSAVGTYPINATLTAVGSASLSNYAVTIQPGTLNVTAGSIGVSLPAQMEVYGQSFVETVNFNASGAAAPTGTITFTSNGKVLCTSNGTASGTSIVCNAGNSGLAVGSYPVTFTYSGDANYAAVSGSTTLVVTPAALTVKADDATRPYGTANPAFTGSVAGLAPTDVVNVSYSTTATASSPVGTYAIVPAMGGAGASNYTLVAVNGALTITQNQKALTINVNGAARAYGAANPAFSGTVTGVLNGDNVVVTYNTAATASSPVGSYAIGASVSGTAAGNYVATIHPGRLDITSAGTVTTIATSGSPANIGATVTLTATVAATNGAIPTGIVNFTDGATLLGSGTLSSSGVATLSTSTLALGNHAITATYAATANFTGSSASLTQVIAAPVGSFTISASPTDTFVRGAATTTFQVKLTAVGAFTGPVALSCSGLPADATCSFASAAPMLAQGGTVMTTMTVTNTAADAKLSMPKTFNPADVAPITAAAVFPVEIPVLGAFLAGFRRRKSLGSQKIRLLLVILFTLGIVGLTGCGCPNTTFKTYTINITGTSTTFNAPAQTTSVLLSVGLSQ